MSITFSISCNCERTRSACPFCGSLMYGSCCAEMYDDETGIYWKLREAESCVHDMASVNVSNHNARDIVEALGLEWDSESQSGMISVANLRSRALLRTALPADEPVAPAISGGDGCVTMIHGGRSEGYIAERCGQLTELVDLAISGGYEVIYWG
jgi:hypothetical protein